MPEGAPLFVDPRWRHAPLGYLPPALDGAAACRRWAAGWRRPAAAAPTAGWCGSSCGCEPDGIGHRRGARDACEAGRPSNGPRSRSALARRRGQAAPGLRAALAEPSLSRAPAWSGWPSKWTSGGEGEAVLRYSFSSAALATPAGCTSCALVPSFFRRQPGRRFATEGRRRTPLLVGADPPLDLVAQVGAAARGPGAGSRARRRPSASARGAPCASPNSGRACPTRAGGRRPRGW